MKKIVVVMISILAITSIYFIMVNFFIEGWTERGQFGDMFGALNAVFSGFALVGVIYTVYLQLKSSEIAIKPHLAFELIDEFSPHYKLKVINIGNGAALNIDFEPLALNEYNTVVFTLNRIISLRPGDSKEVDIAAHGPSGSNDFPWGAHLNPKYANRVMKFNVSYCDIDFRQMNQSFELGLGDPKVTMTKYIK